MPAVLVLPQLHLLLVLRVLQLLLAELGLLTRQPLLLLLLLEVEGLGLAAALLLDLLQVRLLLRIGGRLIVNVVVALINC